MSPTTELLVNQAGPILFGILFLEQVGVPIPAAPWLLAAGAVSATGNLNPLLALALAVLACLIADLIWFYLGRYKGDQALKILCRVSLEPDSCVRRTQGIFTRFGVAGIVAAKFLPGLGILFPPLAGMSRISSGRLLVYDALGSVLYTGCFLYLGSVFSSELERIGSVLPVFTNGALLVFVGLAAAYLAFKFLQRKHLAQRMVPTRLSVPL